MEKIRCISARRRNWNRVVFVFTLFIAMLIFIIKLEIWMLEAAKQSISAQALIESDAFRAQKYTEDILKKFLSVSEEHGVKLEQIIAVYMIDSNFDLSKREAKEVTYENFLKLLKKYDKKYADKMAELEKAYAVIWEDLRYFPVPASASNPKATVEFENSWMFERNFGGTRGHEGTDIMAGINQRGIYPVLSASDGVVEQIGWLPKGGYRIGIRSPNGAYFYYAHLYRYAQEFPVGTQVRAGELIGFMGDSGYGKEGTVGQFAVHLHFGIYMKTEHMEEMSINPYWILKTLEQNKLSYEYE